MRLPNLTTFLPKQFVYYAYIKTFNTVLSLFDILMMGWKYGILLFITYFGNAYCTPIIKVKFKVVYASVLFPRLLSIILAIIINKLKNYVL